MTKATNKRCFLITPIGEAGSVHRKRADWIYRHVQSVCSELNVEADRADMMPGTPMITNRIFEAINSSELCVADFSDLNPNVLYEVGVRHSFRMPIVHLAEEGTKLPFDNAQHDTIFYDLSDVGSVDRLKERLRASLIAMLEPSYQTSNPVTIALGMIEASRSGDSKDKLIAQMAERLSSIEKRLEYRPYQNALAWSDHDLRVSNALSPWRSPLAKAISAVSQPVKLDRSYFDGQLSFVADATEADEIIRAAATNPLITNASEVRRWVLERFPEAEVLG